MKRITVKIGLAFFLCSFLIQLVLFLSLYYSLVNARVNEEVQTLLARGNSHRDVLAGSFTNETIHHVALMETHGDTNVVIADETGAILAVSRPLDDTIRGHIADSLRAVPAEDMIMENHWKTSNYICTISPIEQNGTRIGYVYMFQQTGSLRALIHDLTIRFLVTGGATFVLTVLAMLFLSRHLTKPLISMKKAAERLRRGDLSVSLHTERNDEVGGLARSIQQLAAELDYMKRERSEFLASVAHELRTPLTYVRGYADIANRPDLSAEERSQYVTIIQEEADRVTGLVNDLFELAQMENHSFTIQQERVPLADFLAHVLTKVQPAYKEKGVSLSLSCPPDLQAMLDRARFEQVLLNLLHNALAHSIPGSAAAVQAVQAGQSLLLWVRDEGEGIPAADLPHIFERFYRVDKSRTRTTGGSGLGLAIVKEIVERHGGSITAESAPTGTVFTIQLQAM